MPDFPSPRLERPPGSATIATPGLPFATALLAEGNGVNYAAAAWPSAARAIFVPFVVDQAATALKMFWENGAVAGTTDVGIYDAALNRLVSLAGITNVGTGQVADITDQLLVPGLYYAAMVVSTVTTQTCWSAAVAIPDLRAAGCFQMAAAQPLPATATAAAIASAYLPFLGIQYRLVL